MTTNHQTSIASLAKKRRTYSAEFKQQIVQACNAPDLSIASVVNGILKLPPFTLQMAK